MNYDLAVIGGGPAGYSAALQGAKNGLNVILFENDKIGGTCLNRGCVPTKFLAHYSNCLYEAGILKDVGIEENNVCLNYSKLHEKMVETVNSLKYSLEEQIKLRKITIVNGLATVKNEHLVYSRDKVYEVKDILIATGSVNSLPQIEGAITTDEFLELSEIPRHVAILGGGVIAIEFANILNNFGSEVSVFFRAGRILRNWDREIASGVTSTLRKRGIKLYANSDFANVDVREYDCILSATGRKPSTPEIGFLKGIFDEDGAIITDKFGRTPIPHIYAAGDVVSGSPKLAHTAMFQGKAVADYIAFGKLREIGVYANCIVIGTEAVSVGKTESEAISAGISVVSAKVNMLMNPMSAITTTERSFIKLVADSKTGILIGAQLLCNHATDMSGEFILAINEKTPVKNMLDVIHPHPSFVEAVTDVISLLTDRLNEI